MKQFNIFLAVSYSPACVEHSQYRKTIEALIELAMCVHLAIYAAPAEEKWGKALPTRQQAIKLDHAVMRACHTFVYFTGGFESDGALVELGMAVALKKRILILNYENEVSLSHVRGLVEVGLADQLIIRSNDDLPAVINYLINDCIVHSSKSALAAS
jgi:hypothetical protein